VIWRTLFRGSEKGSKSLTSISGFFSSLAERVCFRHLEICREQAKAYNCCSNFGGVELIPIWRFASQKLSRGLRFFPKKGEKLFFE
jgi:hypothetical protein